MNKKVHNKKMTGKDRRLQIVKVAERLFSERGFRGTTTREIAHRAGVSEATIFKHFARKRDLYEAIIKRRLTDKEGSFILTKRFAGKEGVEIFRELGIFIIERYNEDPTFSRLMLFSALETHEVSDMVLVSKGTETLDFLSGEITKLIKAGRFRPTNAHLAARAFLGMISHYCMLQEIYGYKRFFSCDPTEVVDTFVGIFVSGLETKGALKVSERENQL